MKKPKKRLTMRVENVMSIGTEGKFSFKPPFNTILSTYTIYKIIGISKLSQLKESGVDPLNNIYIASGLTEENYKTDLKNDITIIQLVVGSSTYYIPENFIEAGPTQDGVSYSKQGLAINLGVLPLDIDVTSLISDMEQLIQSHIGVNSNINRVYLSGVSKIPYDISTQFTTIRNSRITNKESCIDKYTDALNTINILNQKVSDLEEVFLAYKNTP